MPGTAIEYIADISAMLCGSLTPHEITHGDLSVARGYQLQALQWIREGYQIEHCSVVKKQKRNRVG